MKKHMADFIKSGHEYDVIKKQLRKRARTPKDLLKCTRRVLSDDIVKSKIFDLISIDEIMWQDGKFRLRGVMTDEDANEARGWYASRQYEDMREKK